MKNNTKKSTIIGISSILLLLCIIQFFYVENAQKFTLNENNMNHLMDTESNPSSGFVLVDPIIADPPSNVYAEIGYSEQSISWTATDSNPDWYTVELQGSGIVAGPTSWASGTAITYDIPDGFALGDYIYIVNFTNDDGDFITDSVTFFVNEDDTHPDITSYHTYKKVSYGYSGQSLSWTATDANPDTYIVELENQIWGLDDQIVAGPLEWESGIAITYDIPDGLDPGDYSYKVIFTDEYDNSALCYTLFTVLERPEPTIGASFEMILIMSLGAVAAIIIAKKKKIHSDLE